MNGNLSFSQPSHPHFTHILHALNAHCSSNFVSAIGSSYLLAKFKFQVFRLQNLFVLIPFFSIKYHFCLPSVLFPFYFEMEWYAYMENEEYRERNILKSILKKKQGKTHKNSIYRYLSVNRFVFCHWSNEETRFMGFPFLQLVTCWLFICW